MLYVTHRAVLREEVECRHGQKEDRQAVEELLLTIQTRQQILADFDLAMDPLQPDLKCFVFKCSNTILGLAVLWLLWRAIMLFSSGKHIRISRSFLCEHKSIIFVLLYSGEKQVGFIRRYYHVEDHVSMQSIRQDEYGHLLHFVLMPIFSAYHRFFFREIARLSELTVIFYRLHRVDESILVSSTI